MPEPIRSPLPVTSPLPVIVEAEEVGMDFPSAIHAITEGKKVTRLEWKDKNIYFLLHGSKLRIHKADNAISDLIVSEGDMLGKDYIIL